MAMVTRTLLRQRLQAMLMDTTQHRHWHRLTVMITVIRMTLQMIMAMAMGTLIQVHLSRLSHMVIRMIHNHTHIHIQNHLLARTSRACI